MKHEWRSRTDAARTSTPDTSGGEARREYVRPPSGQSVRRRASPRWRPPPPPPCPPAGSGVCSTTGSTSTWSRIPAISARSGLADGPGRPTGAASTWGEARKTDNAARNRAGGTAVTGRAAMSRSVTSERDRLTPESLKFRDICVIIEKTPLNACPEIRRARARSISRTVPIALHPAPGPHRPRPSLGVPRPLRTGDSNAGAFMKLNNLN